MSFFLHYWIHIFFALAVVASSVDFDSVGTAGVESQVFIGKIGCKSFYSHDLKPGRQMFTFMQSMDYCHQHNQSLAMFSSRVERDFVVGRAQKLDWSGKKQFWLAAVDFLADGTYIWFYTRLPVDQSYIPVVSSDKKKHCLALSVGSTDTPALELKEDECRHHAYYPLCQKEDP